MFRLIYLWLTTWLTLPRRVLVVLDQPGQTEVSNLAYKVVSHEDVGGSQVPVDVVHPLDECHAVSDLQEGGEKKERNLTASPDGCFEIQNIFSYKKCPQSGRGRHLRLEKQRLKIVLKSVTHWHKFDLLCVKAKKAPQEFVSPAQPCPPTEGASGICRHPLWGSRANFL